MKILISIAMFFIFVTPVLSLEKLGTPIKGEFLKKYYGEEEITKKEGDYSNLYASYEERYILYDLNLYRLAPQILKNEDKNPKLKKCLNWGYCFTPVKPLYYNLNLSRAARFHCNDMIKNNCFSHNDCDGGDVWNRIEKYYKSSRMGENISAGSSYIDVTKNLINEKHAKIGTVGHRESILSDGFNEVGIGYLLGGNYGKYTTQDFGSSANHHNIVVAIHEPKSAEIGKNINFKAIYHDNDKNNPEVFLILENKCYKMNKTHSSHDWSSDNYIGKRKFTKMNWHSMSYEINKKIQQSCNKYSILIKSNNNIYRYPDKGSLLVGENCNKIYNPEEITNTCKDNRENNNNDKNDDKKNSNDDKKNSNDKNNNNKENNGNENNKNTENNNENDGGCNYSRTYNHTSLVSFLSFVFFYLLSKKRQAK